MKDLNFQRRPNEPEAVTMWRKWIRGDAPPKCCFTCDFYTDEGICKAFGVAPPADFAVKLDECQDWVEEIPF